MAGRRFVVSCLHCKRIVAEAGRLGADELNRLVAHLLVCCPSEIANPSLGIEATLRHFRVEPTDPDDKPPPDAA